MSEARDESLAESVPANTPAWSASGLVTQGGSSSTGAAAQGLTSSPSPRRLAAIFIEIILLALVAIAVLVLGLAMAGPAGATTPAEVNVESRDWALSWREQAVRVRARALRHTRALGVKAPAPVPQMQIFWTTEEEPQPFVDWHDYGTALKRQTQSWREHAIPRWHRRLTNPGGSGAARWWPLARFVGWPLSQRANVVTCIWRESRGNPSDGPCLGLMQIHPCHARAYRRVTGQSVWSWRNSEANLKFALWLWRQSGWRPWVTM